MTWKIWLLLLCICCSGMNVNKEIENNSEEESSEDKFSEVLTKPYEYDLQDIVATVDWLHPCSIFVPVNDEKTVSSFSLIICHDFDKLYTNMKIRVQLNNDQESKELLVFTFSQEVKKSDQLSFDIANGVLSKTFDIIEDIKVYIETTFEEERQKMEKCVKEVEDFLLSKTDEDQKLLNKLQQNFPKQPLTKAEIEEILSPTINAKKLTELTTKYYEEFEKELIKNLRNKFQDKKLIKREVLEYIEEKKYTYYTSTNQVKKITKQYNKQIMTKDDENLENFSNVRYAEKQVKRCQILSENLIVELKEQKKLISIFNFILDATSEFQEKMLGPLEQKLKEIQSNIQEFADIGWESENSKNHVTARNPKKEKEVDDIIKKIQEIKINLNEYSKLTDFIDEEKHDKYSKTDIEKVMKDINLVSNKDITYEDKTDLVEGPERKGSHQGYFEVKDEKMKSQVTVIMRHGNKGSTNYVSNTTIEELKDVIIKFEVKQMLKDKENEQKKQIETKKKLLFKKDQLKLHNKEEAHNYISKLRQKDYLEIYIAYIQDSFNQMKDKSAENKEYLAKIKNYYENQLGDDQTEGIISINNEILQIVAIIDKKINELK